MALWKKLAVLLQTIAFILAPLGVASVSHAHLDGPESHSHIALANTGGHDAQSHHGGPADKASDHGAAVSDEMTAGGEESHDLKFCCHIGGGVCASFAVVAAGAAPAFVGWQGLIIPAGASKLAGTSRSGIFHPPRLSA